ncbi:MAG: hypothetical protein ACM359_05655 [Bacillota bacterium]
MKWRIIGAVMAVMMVVGEMAGAQTTRPGGNARSWEQLQRERRFVLVRFAVRDAVSQDDQRREVNLLRVAVWEVGPVTLEAQRWDRGMIITLTGARTFDPTMIGYASREQMEAAVQKVVGMFQKQAIDDEQRRQELGEVQKKWELVRGQMEVLSGFAESQEKLWPGIVVEQIKAGELEKQRLKMELAAKEIRSAAIRRQIEQTEKEVAEKLAKDPTTERLKIIIQQAQLEVSRYRDLAKQNAAAPVEVAKAELDLAQAQARLAERREEVRQMAKGDLLNKLSGELAALMIDLAELEGRLKYLEQTLPPLDLKQLNEQQLRQLAQQYKGFYTDRGTLPPLYNKLDEEAKRLVEKKMSLLAGEVRVISAEEARDIGQKVNAGGEQ